MPVKRFTFIRETVIGAYMGADPNGKWVPFTAYAAQAKYIAALEAECAAGWAANAPGTRTCDFTEATRLLDVWIEARKATAEAKREMEAHTETEKRT